MKFPLWGGGWLGEGRRKPFSFVGFRPFCFASRLKDPTTEGEFDCGGTPIKGAVFIDKSGEFLYPHGNTLLPTSFRTRAIRQVALRTWTHYITKE